jgi:hypothetical protein
MFGPEGRPQHCCAWLGVASSFPECASPIVPEEVKNFPSHSHASLIFHIFNCLEAYYILKIAHDILIFHH